MLFHHPAALTAAAREAHRSELTVIFEGHSDCASTFLPTQTSAHVDCGGWIVRDQSYLSKNQPETIKAASYSTNSPHFTS